MPTLRLTDNDLSLLYDMVTRHETARSSSEADLRARLKMLANPRTAVVETACWADHRDGIFTPECPDCGGPLVEEDTDTRYNPIHVSVLDGHQTVQIVTSSGDGEGWTKSHLACDDCGLPLAMPEGTEDLPVEYS